MKLNLLILLMAPIISGCVTVQTIPPKDMVMENVHEVGLTKETIYNKSLEFMAKKFTDSKEVIQLKDKDQGKIIGKGMTKFTNVTAVIPCMFTVTVDIKEGKYRTIYEDFIGYWGANENQPQPLNSYSFLTQVKKNLSEFDAMLLNFIKTSKASEDW